MNYIKTRVRGQGEADTHLELEPDTVCLGDVEELDQLAPDAVDLLDVLLAACPELDAVDLAP